MGKRPVAQALPDSPRLRVHTPQGRWLATLTRVPLTAISAGPRRTFTEDAERVKHTTLVRALPARFNGKIDSAWLQAAIAANASRRANLLALGMQYLRGAPPAAGRRVQL